tara:strand:- start:2580 stop:2897 length:318 start_codon:yes stop_codon:yes gene_type:complete
LLIGSGAALTSAAVILPFPEVVNANRRASFYFNRAFKKAETANDVGSIAHYNKAIELDPEDALAYYNRGIAKGNLDDMSAACVDWIKSASLGDEDAAEFVKMDYK